MPNFNIIKESKYTPTFRNESVRGQFELSINTVKEQFIGEINIEDKQWSIGLIVGSSGSGKSTIAKQVFQQDYIHSLHYGDNSILDEMPKNKTTEQITSVFNSVGFATVWSWLKPYSVLSNGEKMRVDLAKSILSDKSRIVFDEFTSVVDRTIAKTASFAIQKAVRKLGKQFVAVSCHYDVIEWLEPDWIYDTDKKRFFFAPENTRDNKYNLRLESVTQKTGSYLSVITI